ncbi:hypothetical protein KSF78_0004844 [Schistosoma japonicum]|nr:hypothetical protein KSF78_0004844 [Schistosoma japonicum]
MHLEGRVQSLTRVLSMAE